uniref:Cyclin-dependent kinase G-2 n=1 Tax=Cajanus cajan TaxID=3821 RepID=A0A151U8S2_CAJCA|nr:Cyclin-dependent kinase G-2 [Cajanus cajan]
MAAGRHGGYRENEFRDRESNFDVSRRVINDSSKQEYDRVRNGSHGVARGVSRDARDGIRLREKDIRVREAANGSYRSSSSKSDSGGSGGCSSGLGPKRCGFSVKAMDKEPGELSSESGSDDGIDSGSQEKYCEGFGTGGGNGGQSLLERKRKFSPIVWDQDEREVNLFKHRVVTADDESESPVGLHSFVLDQRRGNEQEGKQPESEDYIPTRNISSSRWAAGDNSSSDEGEITDDKEILKRRKLSPDLGMRIRNKVSRLEECKIEEFVGARAKSSESEERGSRGRSSSGDDHPSIDRGTPDRLFPLQRAVNMLQGCRSVDEFERLNRIDEGTYGVVFRAKDKKSGKVVALKKVKMEKEKEEVVVGSNLDSIFMTSNLLLNNRGELKICDFGLARQYGSPLKPYTHLVVTLWYRAPELLLGTKQYSTAIDMWSLGCIMAELLSKEPLFNGKTEFEQIDKIFRILGTPNETIWPGFSELPRVKVKFVKNQYNLLRKKFPATSFTGSPVLSDSGFDLLNKLLTYDPEKRITAEEALNHEWFREVPLPKSKEFMPTFPAQNAQDRRMRRILKSPDPLAEQHRKEMLQGESGTGGIFG